MAVIWFNSETPTTKFAPNLKIPLFNPSEGSPEFIESLKQQIIKLEQQIAAEDLVSEVPKDMLDPYPYTQHWKQHNLFWDKDAKDGSNITRFEMTPELEKMFHIIRKNYLLFLKELGYPRTKVYVHAWANVLKQGQWITKHHHVADNSAYLSCTYYLTTVPTYLELYNPIRVDQTDKFPTKAGSMLFFPSWVPHQSTVYEGDDVRVSLAFDIVTNESALANPWRPHHLLDDPATMDGFEMYLKNRSLTG